MLKLFGDRFRAKLSEEAEKMDEDEEYTLSRFEQ